MNARMPSRFLISIIQLRAVPIQGVHKSSQSGRISPFLKQYPAFFRSTLWIYHSLDLFIERFILLVSGISSGKKVDDQCPELLFIFFT